MKFSILSFYIFSIFSSPIFSQDKPSVTAKELMQMEADKAFELIGKLNKSQTNELITQVRLYAREEYKDIDKFYLLISHLESMRAIEEEDKKLKDLNLVYFLALALFSALIGFNVFSQRKSIKAIQEHLNQ
jgi:hypothetical protein